MTLTLEQMKANRKAWVEALRSGKFRQANGVLKNDDGAYCCLGLLTFLAGGKWDEHSGTVWGAWACCPPQAKAFVGLNGDTGGFDGGDLAMLNDEGKTFETIADIIESEPPGLFVESDQP